MNIKCDENELTMVLVSLVLCLVAIDGVLFYELAALHSVSVVVE